MANDYYTPSPDEIEARRRSLDEYNIWNERALYSIWALFGRADTYIDFGCGNGHMVKTARTCGVDAVGVDIIAEPPDIIHDLRKPLDLGRKFQLATSIEVAEHLTPEASDTFCETIHRHLIDDGGWLIFTAALPGQQGQNHINLKGPFQWRELFYTSGLNYHENATVKLAYLWKETTGSMHHLPANLQVFVKGTP